MGKFTNTHNLLVVAITLTLAACSDNSGVHLTEISDVGKNHSLGGTPHTDVEQGIWPPQPLGISNVEGYPASARGGAQKTVIESARRALMNNPEIKQVLGENFRQFDSSLGSAKGDVTASFLFYNYLNNTTIEARLTREGGVDSKVYSASEWQPPEHSEEVDEAIALGQASLRASGYETAGLQGTAMLAFPQISQIESTDHHYYPERLLYVTFGPGQGAIPVYSTLVNLSSGTVIESGLVR